MKLFKNAATTARDAAEKIARQHAERKAAIREQMAPRVETVPLSAWLRLERPVSELGSVLPGSLVEVQLNAGWRSRLRQMVEAGDVTVVPAPSERERTAAVKAWITREG